MTKRMNVYYFKLLILISSLFVSVLSQAQQVAISETGTSPDPSAQLDVNATSQGILIPRITSTQRDNIASPAAGLFIFNLSSNGLEYWNGSSWIKLTASISPATNTIGIGSGKTVVISVNANAFGDPSAILDIQTSTGGLLIPRLTLAERGAIQNPIEGLLIYNLNTGKLNYTTNQRWEEVCGVSVSTVTGSVVTSENVGINTNAPHPSSFLDIASSDGGLAIPALTNIQRDAILSPATGLLLYNRTDKVINIYNGAGSWLVYGPNSCSTTCSPLTDVRDGRTYATVQIGTKCWMAENLDYGTYIESTPSSTLVAGQKYCWSNDPTNCTLNRFGGLYEWGGMMNGTLSCNGADSTQPACATPVQGICPAGWHIPSHYEFTLMERNVGSTPLAFPYNTTTAGVWLGSDEATNLRSTDFGGPPPSWSPGGGAVAGTNLSGFNALMAQYESAGTFPNFGSITTWYWTSTETDATTAFSRSIWHNFGSVRRSIDVKDRGYSVRCVRD